MGRGILLVNRKKKGGNCMSFLKLPRHLRENQYLKRAVYKSGESEEIALGRLVFFIDYVSSVGRDRFSHREVSLIAGWKRDDLTYSEVLEYAGFGTISEDHLRLRLPKEFSNKLQQIVAGKERAKGQRDEKGRFLGAPPKPKPSVIDGEGNQRSPQNAEARSVITVDGTPPPPFFPLFSPSPIPSPFYPPIIPPPSPFPAAEKSAPDGQQILFGMQGYVSPKTEKPKLKKSESDAGLEERRELNQFWREKYAAIFGHEYPRPADGRYNAEIKRIHAALGLKLAKSRLEFYLNWKDPFVVKEGHPIEFFMSKLVKMESDRHRHEKKQVTAAQAEAIKKTIQKDIGQKSEVQLAYAKIKGRSGASDSQNLQRSPGVISVPAEAGIRRELSDKTSRGPIHAGDGGVPVRPSVETVSTVSKHLGNILSSEPVSSSHEVLPTGVTTVGRDARKSYSVASDD